MNKKAPILIVDDEADMRTLLQRSLAPELNRVIEAAASGKEALDRMEAAEFDLLLADIRMPGMDGLELLQHVRDRRPDITVVMMTAYGSIETAVTAMRMGAHDFVTKPFDQDALVIRLEKALERSTLLRENSRLKQDCLSDPPPVFQDIAGNSAVMRRVFETIRQVARTDPTVLITGESGTGKELTARAIHALSPRSRGPFISVNCPAVPEQILESELFGYKKGAFTHAVTDKTGLFQASHTGTIFLDEIGDVPPLIQTKLLRVLQEKEIKPLGSSRNVYVDVRIIASTNRDLKEQIRQRAFREDLYYRLNVLPVRLPPLREHLEDLPLIVDHLIKKHTRKLNIPKKTVSPAVMKRLFAHPWPGNVRELENVLLRGILFARTDEIGIDDIELESGDVPPSPPKTAADIPYDLPYREAKEQMLSRFHHAYLHRLLTHTGGNVTRAARACGLERQALQQVMRRYGVKSAEFRKSAG